MKILVAYRQIHNTAGGVERMSNLIMNELVRRGHKIEFFTLDRPDAVSFYPLDNGIAWHKMGIGNPSQKASFSVRLKRIFVLRNILRASRPDIVLAFQEASFLTARLAAIGLGIPVIAAERNSPSRFSFMEIGKRQLAFWSFRFAKFLTIQNESFRSHYPRGLQSKIQTIPNPIFPVSPADLPKENVILSVGRLEYQKNFACLIKAFAKISAAFPDWKLKIIGEGADRPRLEQLIKNLNLQDRVELNGASRDLVMDYSSARIFCLASRWEGFPNALAEALSYALPCLGFGDCDGVRDLIRDGQNGLLATGNDDPETLFRALEALMRDEKLRDELAEGAIPSIKAYEPSAIFDRWERLLKDAAAD